MFWGRSQVVVIRQAANATIPKQNEIIANRRAKSRLTQLLISISSGRTPDTRPSSKSTASTPPAFMRWPPTTTSAHKSSARNPPHLRITTYVNGTQIEPNLARHDPSRTDTIQYVAADTAGMTSTSTRTVIIQAANDNQAQ